jgi:hypothetical protein
MMPGNVIADVGGAVQQQAVADDDERGLDDECAVVGVTLRRDDEGRHFGSESEWGVS